MCAVGTTPVGSDQKTRRKRHKDMKRRWLWVYSLTSTQWRRSISASGWALATQAKSDQLPAPRDIKLWLERQRDKRHYTEAGSLLIQVQEGKRDLPQRASKGRCVPAGSERRDGRQVCWGRPSLRRVIRSEQARRQEKKNLKRSPGYRGKWGRRG